MSIDYNGPIDTASIPGRLPSIAAFERVGAMDIDPPQGVVYSITGNAAPKFTPSTNQIMKMSENGTWQYEIFKLVDEFDPILTKPTFAWDFNNPPGDARYIGISLVHTMTKNRGLGLAAPQVGLPYRMFAMGSGQYASAVINPEIVERYGVDEAPEGCLSSPGLFLKINRAAKVDVRYWDWNGEKREQTFDGLTARVFLHEYDHLDGVLFTSLVSKTVVSHARTKVKTNLRKFKRELEREQAGLSMQRKVSEQAQKQAKLKALTDAAGGTLPNGTFKLTSADIEPKSLIIKTNE